MVAIVACKSANLTILNVMCCFILVLVYDRFGEDLDLLHGFGDAFTEEAGARIVNGFTFNQPRTNTARTLEGVVALLEVRAVALKYCS